MATWHMYIMCSIYDMLSKGASETVSGGPLQQIPRRRRHGLWRAAHPNLGVAKSPRGLETPCLWLKKLAF